MKTTRASWIQKHVLNYRPRPRRKPIEGELSRLSYPALHHVRQRESLRLSAKSNSTDLTQEQGIETVYTELLKDIYTNSPKSNTIKTGR